ncbi:ORF6N domain-containing protein [Clostridium sp.]|uniref:ORF6N domain-containing protein n=1 Tax=Clostridium sp. TaxID=1506 RepID=UPI00290F77CF|nr:ORF6N domain-containing protein [Clostridium sp.]MDU7212972.1 ORF6N domain-containing protein [Clostridium sp.]
MNNLTPLEFKNQRIITTKVLAEEFGTEEGNIQKNYSRNEKRFLEGKHYYKLAGQALKEFKNSLPTESLEPIKFAPVLYLWTDRGAARHAKILDTDEAWEVYEDLEENYFNPEEKVKDLNTSELSLELQMFNQMFKAMANNELEAKEAKRIALNANNKADEVKEEIQSMRDVITLDSNGWRKETATLINKIANKLGGFEHIRNVREESYKLLNENYSVDINRRLKNKQKNMALEGVSRSKINKVNVLDVIAEDKKLLNGYISIVTKMAIRYGVA